MERRRRLGETVEMSEEVLRKSCTAAIRAHRSFLRGRDSAFLVEKPDSYHTVIAFPGSWSLEDWYSFAPVTSNNNNLHSFSSLKSIGSDEAALLNPAFLRRFALILQTSPLEAEVRKAAREKKKIVFTGHSLGGSTAIFATIWWLEECRKSQQNQDLPFCVTFGSPLVGDRVLGHALRREGWSCRFLHFILRYDIVPRTFLASLPSNEQQLFRTILQFLDPNSPHSSLGSIGISRQVTVFFETVMRNAHCVASHSACLAMGCTNLLLEAIPSFIDLSPYRPFGMYVFCTGNGGLVHVENPEAVLQMLFYCLQLSPEQEVAEVACRSLREHLAYESVVREWSAMQDVVYLDHHLEELPLTLEHGGDDVIGSINTALKGLGLLSMEARLSLQASGRLEKQKYGNQDTVDGNCQKIEEALKKLEVYRAMCETLGMGCYDAFKFQREERDFKANVKRLELAGLWDEIVEMLKRYELPDGFEARKKWIELGTRYRRLVEPLDIANYYRHAKNEDTGPYMIKGRPKRYRFTQRWLEWANRMDAGSASDSSFWAEVEEVYADTTDNNNNHMVPFGEETKQKVLKLEREVLQWAAREEWCRDVFLEDSTFIKWWKTLPPQHRLGSCIAGLMRAKVPSF